MYNLKSIEIPKFLSGTILKSKDLISIRDNFLNYVKNKYIDYNNGIIKGFLVEVDEENLIINPGIAKKDDNIFWLKDKFCIKFSKEKQRKFIYLDIFYENDEICGKILVLDEENTNYIELARYNLRDNAILNNFYKDIFNTDVEKFNTINLEYTNISNEHNDYNMIHYEIIKLWCGKMLEKSDLEINDFNFLVDVVNMEYKVPLDILSKYIYLKKQKYIFNKLEILRELYLIFEEDNSEKILFV